MKNLIGKCISWYLLRNNGKFNYQGKKFAGLFSRTESIILIAPEDEKRLHYTTELLSDLLQRDKKITIFLEHSGRSYFNRFPKVHFEEYFLSNRTKFNTPKKPVQLALKSLQADMLINLIPGNDLFSDTCSAFINAETKIGINKKLKHPVYNFQITIQNPEPEKTYEKLLNCLLMF